MFPLERCGKWITLHEEPRSPESVRMQLLKAMQDGADVSRRAPRFHPRPKNAFLRSSPRFSRPPRQRRPSGPRCATRSTPAPRRTARTSWPTRCWSRPASTPDYSSSGRDGRAGEAAVDIFELLVHSPQQKRSHIGRGKFAHCVMLSFLNLVARGKIATYSAHWTYFIATSFTELSRCSLC